MYKPNETVIMQSNQGYYDKAAVVPNNKVRFDLPSGSDSNLQMWVFLEHFLKKELKNWLLFQKVIKLWTNFLLTIWLSLKFQVPKPTSKSIPSYTYSNQHTTAIKLWNEENWIRTRKSCWRSATDAYGSVQKTEWRAEKSEKGYEYSHECRFAYSERIRDVSWTCETAIFF